jgi:hypothetical protein
LNVRPFPVFALAVVLVARLSSAAAADDTIEPLPPSPPFVAPPEAPESRWYGAPALAVDGAVLVGAVVLAAGRYEPSTTHAVLYGLTAIYLLDGPVVHLLHGRVGRSAESLLLRAGTLAAGVAIGLSVLESSGCYTDSFPHASTCDWAGYGMVLSPGIAILIDDLLLARQSSAPTAPSISSRVLVQPGLAMLGVGGTF